LKSKHRICAIHEGEDHKTVPVQEEIRSQIVEKEMSLFEATKKRSNNLEKLLHAFNYNQTQISGNRGLFQSRNYLSQNSETD